MSCIPVLLAAVTPWDFYPCIELSSVDAQRMCSKVLVLKQFQCLIAATCLLLPSRLPPDHVNHSVAVGDVASFWFFQTEASSFEWARKSDLQTCRIQWA